MKLKTTADSLQTRTDRAKAGPEGHRTSLSLVGEASEMWLMSNTEDKQDSTNTMKAATGWKQVPTNDNNTIKKWETGWSSAHLKE